MAGEFSLQFNPRAFSDPSLTYGTNPAFGMGPDNIAVNTSDAGTRQFRLAFQDSRSENVPQQMQNIVSDNRVGKKLDFSV